ncbi:MAG: VacJ family lipoprotein [Oceanidesulfovibrio sp.]
MTRIPTFFLLCLILVLGAACSARQSAGPEALLKSDGSSMASLQTGETVEPAESSIATAQTGKTVEPNAGFGDLSFLDSRPYFFDDPDLAFDVVVSGALHTGLAADEYDVVSVADPLEGWNRFWFNFNDALYTVFLQPLGRGYNFIMPEKGRVGVRNFFDNLKAPVYIINSLLQGKFKGAGVHMSRFIGNTAFGFLGFAGTFNDKKGIVETDEEDFGQTLAVWGFGDGFYLVLPLLGPTTLRDGIGMGVDNFFTPITYIAPWPFWESEPWQWWTEYGVWTYHKFNYISFKLDYYDDFKATALSPYTAMRDAYIQMRRSKIAK